MINFECECGEKFSLEFNSNKLSYDMRCESSDDFCSCCGFIYYADCPKCNARCKVVSEI